MDARDGSGPLAARLFDRLLALIFLVAWLSLRAQIDVLVGSRGLLPAAPWLASIREQPFLEYPTILRLSASDAALHGGLALGALLAILALFGVAPRLAFAAQTALYLGYAIACRGFLGFQWDNLLLECGLLAAILPRDRRARWAHALFRVLLFKLYWESGLAKWRSPLHDWQDGSAMTFYYETAPLPARLAHALHALPAWWHHLESWFTLAFELALPLAIFGPRRARLAAAAVFTVFQIVNIATANYGFFAYLALALHVFLLDERDLRRARRALAARLPALPRLRAQARRLRLRARRALPVPRLPVRARLAGAIAFSAAYGVASLTEGAAHFGPPGLVEALAPLRALYSPFRVVNAYHLFAAITRERIEPEVQTSDGSTWTPHDLRYKPGDPARAPDLVAPHQPRVDFLLWFYGLSYRRGAPPYVGALLDRVCHDPAAVQPLFPAPLPPRPEAARIVFQRYRFTSPEERARTGAWWTRELVGSTRPVACE